MKKLILNILVFSLVFFSFLYAIKEQKEIFKPEKHEVTVQLVLVDVIATDKNGNVVTDLTKDDFELYEDGKMISINSVDFIQLQETDLEKAESTGVSFRKRRFIVIFDSMNTIARMLERSKSQIIDKLISLIKLGHEIMVFELSDGERMRVVQPFTSDEDLIVQAVNEASGSIWIEKSADVLGAPTFLEKKRIVRKEAAAPIAEARSILENFQEASRNAFQFEMRIRFEKTIDGLLAVLNAIKDYPGRKPILLVSGGIPTISFAKIFQGKNIDVAIARSEVASAKVEDPFEVLGKSGRRGSDDIINNLIRFANSHNITFYTMDPDNYLRYMLPDIAYDNFPRRVGVGDANVDEIAEIKRTELQSLKYFAQNTGGASMLGAKKFDSFQEVINKDLSSYYELSYYPRRKKADGKYHKIKAKVKRPGIKIRFRKGYYDYTEDQRESLLFASASSNPTLFTQIPFHARAVPFVQKKNAFQLWINMAFPVKKLFLEGSEVDTVKNLKVNMCVENMNNVKAFSTQVNLPINLTSSFLNRLRKAQYFGFNTCSQELKFKKEAYRIIFALYDESILEVGTVVQEFEIPDLTPGGEAKIINAVFGRLNPLIRWGGKPFLISQKNGTLKLTEFEFYPMGLNHLSQREYVSLFMQVFVPQRSGKVKSRFFLLQDGEEKGHVAATVVEESWNKKTGIINCVYKLDFGKFPKGEYTLRIELSRPSEDQLIEKEILVEII